MTTKESTLDEALRMIRYGFYIVTTRKDAKDLQTGEKDYIAAGTVSWAMQSSFTPPMLTIAIKKDSDLHETIARAESFALTILGKEDSDLISRFSGDSQLRDRQINGVEYTNGSTTGSPLLKAGIAHLECEVEDVILTKGDHVLFTGRIIGVAQGAHDGHPLTKSDTSYHYGGTN